MTINIRFLSLPVLIVAAAFLLVLISACQPKNEPGAEPQGHDEHGAEEAHDEHGAEEAHEEEGGDQVTIPQQTAREIGIRIAAVGGGVIRDEHDVQGLLTPVEGQHARIRARFPGPVLAVKAGVGDVVKSGQTLALIESNVSLSEYAVTAPFAGTVLNRSVGVGDQAGDEPLFEIANLSKLWVDLHLFGADAQHISEGLPVDVVRLSDGAIARTKLDRVLPGTATASQSTVARATIANSDGRWRPGMAVLARVTVAEHPALLIVPLSALQTFEGASVVFVAEGDVYSARPVKTGARDGQNVEVLEGLMLSEQIVVEQSYMIKAELEKGGAAHEH